ncbi:MAG: dihydropteroate synthase [Saprospiraceae bacterium]|nr:dihydropteroate synthase [Saprospiraceae bacterium]
MKQAVLQAIFDPEPRLPLVMGIMNLDPNSFYKASIPIHEKDALDKIEKWIQSGMSILDIGAFTSRPGSKIPKSDDELRTLLPCLKAISKEFPELVVSIDTVHSDTAKACIESGAEIINDISGGLMDPKMAEIISQDQKILVLMHMRGSPENMQSKENINYENILTEIIDYFINRVETLRKKAVTKIIIDPGFGFSKTLTDNYKILSNLSLFKILDAPLMVGLSRKSMFWKIEQTSAEQVLPATLTANTFAILNGCRIIRVHDVDEHMQSIRVIQNCQNELRQI